MFSFKQLDVGWLDPNFVKLWGSEPAALDYLVICSRLCSRFNRQLIEVVLLTCKHVMVEESSTIEG